MQLVLGHLFSNFLQHHKEYVKPSRCSPSPILKKVLYKIILDLCGENNQNILPKTTGEAIQFRSVQDGIDALRRAYIMCSTPSLGHFLNVAFDDNFNVCLTDNGPISFFQGRSFERFLCPRLSPLGDQSCDTIGFVPAGSVSSSSTLQIFQDANHL